MIILTKPATEDQMRRGYINDHIYDDQALRTYVTSCTDDGYTRVYLDAFWDLRDKDNVGPATITAFHDLQESLKKLMEGDDDLVWISEKRYVV